MKRRRPTGTGNLATAQSDVEDKVTALAQHYWEAEVNALATRDALLGWGRGAREALEQFVENFGVGPIDWDNVRTVKRLIRRALEVDLSIPANRKGDIPKALGLVSRVDPAERMKQRVIYLLMDNLRWSALALDEVSATALN